MYTGNEPYLFISYSHKDMAHAEDVIGFLDKYKYRYWYDKGLQSGSDWNMIIAEKLHRAACCLLLLSERSANSFYVKNEINFAFNCRIPMYILSLEEFRLPIDLELMLGRIQMIPKDMDYELDLLSALPTELMSGEAQAGAAPSEYPENAYSVDRFEGIRGNVSTYSGVHRLLGYPVTVRKFSHVISDADSRGRERSEQVIERMKLVSGLKQDAIPHVFDVCMNNGNTWVYSEAVDGECIDSMGALTDDIIKNAASSLANALAYLDRRGIYFKYLRTRNVYIRSDGRVSLVGLEDENYGLFKPQFDRRDYYLTLALESFACILWRMCTGKEPVLPLKYIDDSTAVHSRAYLKKLNYIIQNCVKSKNNTMYDGFDALLRDLDDKKQLGFSEKSFLAKRKRLLAEYEKQKTENEMRFTSDDFSVADIGASHAAPKMTAPTTIEEKFGMEGTVLLRNNSEGGDAVIKLLICTSGEVLNFDRRDIVIGRVGADMALTQPAVSKRHLQIKYLGGDDFCLIDLNSRNGSYLGHEKTRIPPEGIAVKRGVLFYVADVPLRIV